MTTTHTQTDHFLRFALRLDATASGAMGLAGLVASPALAGLLGAPAPAVLGVGAFFVAFAATLFWLASRPVVSRPFARTIALGNAAWVLASVVTAGLATTLTPIGTAVVLAQALAVAVFAGLQWLGLRRAR